jgi:3,2-trans-enoyl-CoA isomerase
MIKLEHEKEVLIAKLDHGITNAINLELVNELDEVIENVKKDKRIRGLILTSANDKFFSIGFNIPELYELEKNDFTVFYKAFNRLCMNLYSLPKPTIAGLIGHAVAGGCIIALCCDYRYIAAGKTKMGLNEIKLGVPIPYPVDCMLRHLVGFRIAREITDIGDFYEPRVLLDMGMVDKIVDPDKIHTETLNRILSMIRYPQNAFAMIKLSRIEPVLARIHLKLAEKEDAFLSAWYEEETRRRLKGAMDKF